MTRDDLYVIAAQRLGIVGVGETLAAEDQTLIAARYAIVHDQLQSLGLATWALTEDVPDFAAGPVSLMTAANAADEFGIPEPRRTIMRAEGLLNLAPVSQAERALRVLLARPYVPTAASAEYF